MLPSDDVEARSIATDRVAAAIGHDHQSLEVRVLGRSRFTGALACRVDVGGRAYFARVFVTPTVRTLAPLLLPSDALRERREERVRDVIDREWEGLVRLARSVGSAAVPAPHARSDTTIVCSWVHGEPLQRTVERTRRPLGRAGALEPAMRAAGGWLRSLHKTARDDHGVLDLQKELSAVRLRAGEVGSAARGYVARAEETLAELARRLGTSTPSAALADSHGDFSFPNLMVTRPGLTAVDLEHFGRRFAIHDLIAFVANVRAKLVDPRYRRDEVIGWEAAFWAGYGPSYEQRLLASALGTVRLLCRFAPTLLRARWGRPALAAADLMGRGFSIRLIEQVTWQELPTPSTKRRQ